MGFAVGQRVKLLQYYSNVLDTGSTGNVAQVLERDRYDVHFDKNAAGGTIDKKQVCPARHLEGA